MSSVTERAAIPRAVRLLDCSRPLSDALCEILVAGDAGASGASPFDFARTMVLVPGGRLGQALERRLIARARAAGQPLIAPTVVTPLVFGSRFVVPERAILPVLSARLSWRATLERVQLADAALAADVARIFQADAELPAPTRARLADRLHRLSSDVAAAMQSFELLSAHPEVLARPIVAERVAVLARVERAREALLAEAGVADRDGALRDAVRAGRIDSGSVDRIVVLLADPEPVQRTLLARLGDAGVRVEVCVHTDASIDRDGFPLVAEWESRGFGIDRIPADAIEVSEGPGDAADAVVAAVRSLPLPRPSDDIAVMAPDDETRRSIERAVTAAGSRVAGEARRAFTVTRIGTLLAALAELVETAGTESLAAFVRHPDAARWLGDRGIDGAADAVSEYRAATLVSSWRDAVVSRPDRRFEAISRTYRAVQAAVLELTGPLGAARAANEWGPVLRSTVQLVVGEDRSGAFDGERAATVYSLDRALAALASAPAACAVPLGCAEAIALVLGEASRRAIRVVGHGGAARGGPATEDEGGAGLSVIGWLDAGMADERHLILAGFADGAVPEGAVTDAVLPDDLRRALGMASSLRRAARDCWILDGIVRRAQSRAGASLKFVVPRRTAEGDPLRPSRFLLRTDAGDLPARASLLFSEHGDGVVRAAAAGSSTPAAFPRTPAVAVNTIRSVSVTAFKTFIECPYLFQLRNEPRLRLGDLDERAAELDARAFGTLVHAATEAWGREEIAAGARTEDADAIERALHAHLDAHVRGAFPDSVLASVRVQVELARRRLSRFARLQADAAKSGWRLHAVELSFAVDGAGGACAAPRFPSGAGDAASVFLTGRIDRVDINDDSGAVRALDYKTSSRASTPSATHLVRRGPRKGEWKDLQLPLYRVLLRSMPRPLLVGGGGLGYINLAPNAEHSRFEFLDPADGASDEALEQAEASAAAIVARILAGDFTPSERVPVRAGDAFAPVWGLGMRGVESEAAADAASVAGGEVGND